MAAGSTLRFPKWCEMPFRRATQPGPAAEGVALAPKFGSDLNRPFIALSQPIRLEWRIIDERVRIRGEVMSLATLGGIINTAYILFCFALGVWAGVLALRAQPLSGQFFGAMWTGAGLAVTALLIWLLRTLAGEQLRSVYLLYELYFVIVLPGTFALLRGRDDRAAALIFAGVAIFTALAAVSAADPSRQVITPPRATPIVIAPTPTQIG